MENHTVRSIFIAVLVQPSPRHSGSDQSGTSRMIRIVTIAAIQLAGLMSPDVASSASAEHPISITEASLYVTRTKGIMRIQMFAEDLLLFQGLEPNDQDRIVAEDLRRGRVQILVASDTAARSLDVAGTAHVVNYEVPQTAEDYVHRLGRAGRGDPVGDAFTLMSPDEQKYVDAIEQFLGRAIPRVVLPDFDYTMVPGSLRSLVDDEPKTPRPEAALHAASAKVATVNRGGANGSTLRASTPAPGTSRNGASRPSGSGTARNGSKTTRTARPATAKHPHQPKGARTATKPAALPASKRPARPAAGRAKPAPARNRSK